MKRAVLIAALMLLIGALPARASSAFVVVTDTMIVIAVDGASSVQGAAETHPRFCKIVQEGNVFITAVGVYINAESGLDLFGSARFASKSPSPYRSIENAVQPKMPQIVQWARQSSPADYAKWLQGIPAIAVVFALFQNGVAVVYTDQFRINELGVVLPPYQHTLYGRPDPQGVNLGYNSEMNKATTQTMWAQQFTTDPINFANEMIQLEIDLANKQKRPDVGRSISIVKITRDSGGWVANHRGAC